MATESVRQAYLPTELVIPGVHDITLFTPHLSASAVAQKGSITFDAQQPWHEYEAEIIAEDRFGAFLKERRGGMVSQMALARDTQVNQSTISEAENGTKSLRMDIAAVLYKALGGQALYLLLSESELPASPGAHRAVGIELSSGTHEKRIGALLRAVRLAQAVPQTQLAKLARTGQCLISDIENARSNHDKIRSTRARTLRKCFAALNVHVAYCGLPSQTGPQSTRLVT